MLKVIWSKQKNMKYQEIGTNTFIVSYKDERLQACNKNWHEQATVPFLLHFSEW